MRVWRVISRTSPEVYIEASFRGRKVSPGQYQIELKFKNQIIRQPIEGSGFAIALRVVDNGVSVPYSLKGFQLEFTPGGRR